MCVVQTVHVPFDFSAFEPLLNPISRFSHPDLLSFFINTTVRRLMLSDEHTVVEKFGTDGKMTFANFELWWTSTYTTYNEDALARIVEEVNDDTSGNHTGMEPIPEIPELSEVPHNSNVAISRS